MADTTSHNPWDQFIYWARKIYELDYFEEMERSYKLAIAERIEQARIAFASRQDNWLQLLKRSFTQGNNITGWQQHATFLEWIQNNPDAGAQALSVIWNPQMDAHARFDTFQDILPKSSKVSSVNLVSFLNMANKLEEFPPYKPSRVKDAYRLTAFHYEDENSFGAVYQTFLDFLDEFIRQAAERDLVIRDRLDAQGLMWSITFHDAHDPWTDEEKRAFRTYRGITDPKEKEPVVTVTASEPLSEVPVPEPAAYKIAPGHQGSEWEDCLDGGYICVGWDEVGDLHNFASYEDFSDTFNAQFLAKYDGNQGKISEKSREVWTMTQIEPGDLIVANRGMSHVLGIGTVREPGYVWRDDRNKYKHTLTVDWDASVAGPIEKQPYWAFQTILKLPVNLVRSFQGLDRTVTTYTEPPFSQISDTFDQIRLRIRERNLRKYHLSLKTRGFVILAGPSGTGKTWLATAYADAVGAEHAVVSVAPNWTSNEDLLGYFNPMTDQYHHTAFSTFIANAADAWQRSERQGVQAQPYHLILDEMNLARIEYYFASFLSAMETRTRLGLSTIQIGPGHTLELTPNLKVIGTVNIDETTHGFADKVYDRAQLIELEIARDDVITHLGEAPYAADVLAIWDAIRPIGVFAYRVLDEIAAYVESAKSIDVGWEEALDEQVLQKVLPKVRGANLAIGKSLEDLALLTEGRYPLSHARVSKMLEEFRNHGIASYFS